MISGTSFSGKGKKQVPIGYLCCPYGIDTMPEQDIRQLTARRACNDGENAGGNGVQQFVDRIIDKCQPGYDDNIGAWND